MNTSLRIGLLAAVAIFLSACTAYTAIDSGSRQQVDGMSVKVVGKWSGINGSAVPLGGADAAWTVDGLSLNRLVFYSAVGTGDSLSVTGNDDEDAKMPTFRAGMTESGVMELVEGTFARSKGVVRAVAGKLRPRKFAGRNGFSFEVDMVNENQVELRALVAGATVDGKLYLVYFAAPSLHFFDKELPTVNAIFDSIQLEGADV